MRDVKRRERKSDRERETTDGAVQRCVAEQHESESGPQLG